LGYDAVNQLHFGGGFERKASQGGEADPEVTKTKKEVNATCQQAIRSSRYRFDLSPRPGRRRARWTQKAGHAIKHPLSGSSQAFMEELPVFRGEKDNRLPEA
jgi:hypothetical protein